MSKSEYSNPSAIHILRAAPFANWRKCWDCGRESLHVEAITPWVLCPHCKSQDTRLMRDATEMLREAAR